MSRRYETSQQHGSGRGHSRHKVTVKVCMLDDSVVKFEIEPKAKGQLLFDLVYEYLNLEECEYFGLSYYDKHDNLFWLDQLKQIKKQVQGFGKILFRFSVKFYSPDPAMIQEEYTRYLFALQVKRDLLNGKLKCSESTTALLASYIVQGEIGDFDAMTCQPGYLSEFQFFPSQTQESEARISEFHKQHRGLSPGDSDYNLLDVARRLEMYGITLYPAEDKDGVPLSLSAANMGLLVFQNDAKINTFSWAKIRKLSFKRRRFLIKLHPEIFGHYKDVVEFQMSSRDACKSFWKIALSTHAFFRQAAAKPLPKQGPRVFSRGSSFRYSGRTQKQIIENCRDGFRTQPAFQRTQSLKVPMRNASSSSSQPAAAKAYAGYGNVETRVVEAAPAAPEPKPEPRAKPAQQEDHQEIPNGQVVSVEPPRSLPLKDLDEEPDMMRDESDESHHGSVADLEWQPEPVNIGQKTIEAENESQQGSVPPRNGTPKLEEPKKFDVGSPLSVYNIENEDKSSDDFAVPPGVVRVHLEPQPKPMSPIEVDEASSTSSPPPPPPEDEEVAGIVNETEKLPSPPPELLPSPVASPEMLPSPPPELMEEKYEEETVKEDEELPPPPPEEEPTEITSHNGFQEENVIVNHTQHQGIHIECKSVAKVQNGSILRHSSKVSSRGSRTSQQSSDTDTSSAQDNVFEEPASPFRSELEMSPPVSPTTPTGFKNIEAIAKAAGGAAFNMARELLDTERTYVKDLEVITIAFRDIVSGEDVLPETVKKLLFSTVDPIYDFHCAFLEELEKRMQLWNGSNDQFHRIGDLLLRNMKQVKRYVHHLKRHDEVMLELERSTRKSKSFEIAYKEFELQKVCYLPFNAFLLKPAQRLMHYKFLLERLLRFYPQDHIDHADSKAALDEIIDAERGVEETMKKLENFQKIIELQRDLIGVENLVQPGREFIREGCLQKMCRKGPQPRMFFLFSDILLYTCKGVTLTNQFRVRGQLPLSNIQLDDQGPEMHGLYPLTITVGSREFVLAAHSTEEKYKWMEDLNTAIRKAKQKATCNKCSCNPSTLAYRTPKMRSTHYICEECYATLDEAITNGDGPYPEAGRIGKVVPLPTPVTVTRNVGDEGSDDEMSATSPVSTLDKRHAHCHTMSTRRVCWHRNTSVSMAEHALSVRNQMSGELLRKFKTGNRWQKLWVVFTNFCLFFYKSHEDDYPLASLPLIGYTVTRPLPADNIDRELVFKLQYKTHVYFFRAESEYSFLRWMEVIASATESSSRTRIFSRQESSAT